MKVKGEFKQQRPRVLFVVEVNPFLKVTGSQQRSYLILKTLTDKFNVDVLTLDSRTEIPREFSDTARVLLPQGCHNKLDVLFHLVERKLGLSPYEVFAMRHIGMARELKRWIKSSDYRFICVRYLDILTRLGLEWSDRLVVDIDDVPSLKYKSNVLLGQGRLDKNDLKRIGELERMVDKLIEKSIISFVPDKEAAKEKCIYLPNIPINYKKASQQRVEELDAEKCKLLFVGLLSYPPNKLGVEVFLREVWPLVLKKLPDAEFYIVGKGLPEEYLQKWSDIRGVRVLGFVEDLETVYKEASMAVVPIYSGAGTNIKVLEALAYGTPVVMSKFGLRGFEHVLKDGENSLIAEDYKDFANKILELYRDPRKAKLFSGRGKAIIREHYNFDVFKSTLLEGINYE